MSSFLFKKLFDKLFSSISNDMTRSLFLFCLRKRCSEKNVRYESLREEEETELIFKSLVFSLGASSSQKNLLYLEFGEDRQSNNFGLSVY